MARSECLYDLLGVADDATDDELKRAYREAARLHHPDVNPDAEPGRFGAVSSAYDVLRDPARRRAYDATRAWERGVDAGGGGPNPRRDTARTRGEGSRSTREGSRSDTTADTRRRRSGSGGNGWREPRRSERRWRGSSGSRRRPGRDTWRWSTGDARRRRSTRGRCGTRRRFEAFGSRRGDGCRWTWSRFVHRARVCGGIGARLEGVGAAQARGARHDGEAGRGARARGSARSARAVGAGGGGGGGGEGGRDAPSMT